MSKRVEVTCPKSTCGYKWSINVDDLQGTQTFYKGSKDTQTEEYTVKCPRCLDKFVVRVRISG